RGALALGPRAAFRAAASRPRLPADRGPGATSAGSRGWLVTSRRRVLVYLAVVAVPAAVAVGWWYYWPQYRLAQAERAAGAGDWGRAAELVRPLTQTEPASKGALLLGGRALRKLGRFDEAEKLLTRAAKLSPNDHSVKRELALTRADRLYSP